MELLKRDEGLPQLCFVYACAEQRGWLREAEIRQHWMRTAERSGEGQI